MILHHFYYLHVQESVPILESYLAGTVCTGLPSICTLYHLNSKQAESPLGWSQCHQHQCQHSLRTILIENKASLPALGWNEIFPFTNIYEYLI